MDEISEFNRYFEDITGVPVRLKPLSAGDKAKLTLYLTGLYDLQVAELFGRRWVLAIQQPLEPGEKPIPSEMARHVEQLRSALEKTVVLVLAGLTPYIRKQLMRQGIPFFAPGSQVFLPMVWIDLRQRYPREPATRPETLSAAAQVVILYHLLKESIEGRSLRELAVRLGYSAMTLSNVADELAAAELCRVESKNRSRMLRVGTSRRDLWEKARPVLRTPVRSRQWVTWDKPPTMACTAGLTALASRTLLADDPLPVYALRDRDLRQLQATNKLVVCPGSDEAVVQVECWIYAPGLLGDGKMVDPLSLILSLADHPDERVQKALAEVEADVW